MSDKFKEHDNNISADFETMALGDNPAIVQMAFVRFNCMTGEIFERFEACIPLQNAALYGDVDPGTVVWWAEQTQEARQAANLEPISKPLSKGEVAKYQKPFTSTEDALAEFFTGDLYNNANRLDSCFWGHEEADFKWFTNVAKKISGEDEMGRWQSRGIRTLQQMAVYAGMDMNEARHIDYAAHGVQHDAMTDAIAQAKHIAKLCRFLHDQGVRANACRTEHGAS